MYKKLTIVSDTAIFCDKGKYFAFGPVVREVENFEYLFEEITWIGFNRLDKQNDLSMQEIKSKKINVVFLKNVGGKKVLSFLNIVFNYPAMLYIIIKHIYTADVVHTRAPSHPAFIAVIVSFFLRKKIWWNKFAGSWNSKTLPFFYKVQKNILIKAKHTKVTINGFWENQPQHCLSFENPCLTNNDLAAGKISSDNKKFEAPFIFTFVGRLESAKGVDRIIEALQSIPLDKIAQVHFIGDGEKTIFYKEKTTFLKDKIHYHGFLGKERVHQILAESHFLLLPSDSEGFPKVIAEAACYGAIPIVSNVGSIAHYINDSNGFVWDLNSNKSYTSIVAKAINANSLELKKQSIKIQEVAQKFTFTNYLEKLHDLIFIS